jgi:hypothetical protein
MIRTYAVILEGLTPLLMHWDNIEWADQMEEWKKDPKNKANSKAGDDRSPAYRWIGSVYHDGKQICIASDNLSTCMMEGGMLVPTGSTRGAKTFKAQTQSGMKVDDMFIPLIVDGKSIPWAPIETLMGKNKFTDHLEATKKLGFRLFTKRAKINGKTKHIRVRPRFDSWSLEFTITVWDDGITESVIRNILEHAGNYRGLCDWRPGSQKPGPYGMFKLAALTEL